MIRIVTRALVPFALVAVVGVAARGDLPGRTSTTSVSSVSSAARGPSRPQLTPAAIEPAQPSRAVRRTPPPPDPGTLPQTGALPRTGDAAFQDHVNELWQAIVNDDPDAAMPFFFPQGAYIQVKDIGDPVGDYQYRLVGYFRLDVHSAHALLGASAARAKLVGVDVPTAVAEWMPPGSEENKVPYYRVYGARVRYQVDGATKSFGIFSMLSWRGQWYVVHFGPWPRWVRVGAVDDPRG